MTTWSLGPSPDIGGRGGVSIGVSRDANNGTGEAGVAHAAAFAAAKLLLTVPARASGEVLVEFRGLAGEMRWRSSCDLAKAANSSWRRRAGGGETAKMKFSQSVSGSGREGMP